MTGPDALYYGTAALYYVINHTPPGILHIISYRKSYLIEKVF